jgi:hypothetical protein
VHDHRDGEAVVEEIAVDLLRLGSPGWPAREAPVYWQGNANARARDVAATYVASLFVVLVELVAARGHIAAVCPGIVWGAACIGPTLCVGLPSRTS